MEGGKGRVRIRYRLALEFEREAVESVRERLREEGRKVPIDSYNRAARWIEHRQEDYEAGMYPPNRERGLPFVAYVPPDSDTVHHAAGVQGSPLRPLAEFATRMSRQYTIRNRCVVAYVLTDRLRFVPRLWKINYNPLEDGEFAVKVTFHSPDFSREDVNKIVGKIRGAWGAKGDKVLGEEEASLLRAIEAEGGIPTEYGAKGEFWENVAERIGATNKDAAMRRSQRLKRKLRRQQGGHLI